MSLLRQSIAASRLSAAGNFRAAPRIASTTQIRSVSQTDLKPKLESDRKTSSSDPPSDPKSHSTMISKESPKQQMPKNNPDYNVEADYRTSTFSPIPKRVMDGSEPGDSVAAAVLSGAPIDLQARVVRIYRPAKTATQSGNWHSHQWLMDWDPLQKGFRWENPMMGWQSSADCMNGMRMPFKSKDEAIRFAMKQGYEYFVQEPNERRIIPKAYANNFMHSPKKLKHIRTK